MLYRLRFRVTVWASGEIPGGQPGEGDTKGEQSSEDKWRIADQDPIDDPRREAKQNAHDRSVYGRGQSAET